MKEIKNKESLLMRKDSIRQTPEPRSITIAQAACVARNIRDKCNDLYHQTSGEVMDTISGLVVVISEALCSETDPVNIWQYTCIAVVGEYCVISHVMLEN